MFTFSEYARKTLENAGWSEEHIKDTAEIKRELVSAGYVYSPIIDEFLRYFAGLHLRWPHISDKRLRSRMDIDPLQALSESIPEEFERYKSIVAAKFCLVGLFSDTIFLLMTLEGRLYGVTDQIVILYGESGEEGIDNILTNKFIKNWEIIKP